MMPRRCALIGRLVLIKGKRKKDLSVKRIAKTDERLKCNKVLKARYNNLKLRNIPLKNIYIYTHRYY